MTTKPHIYSTRLVWDDGASAGTRNYASYSRRYRVSIAGKPDIDGSADPMFRGDGTRLNPEDLFVTAISSCHMLSYLALCARKGVNVLSYEDDARGTLAVRPDGSGKFDEVVLTISVTVADATMIPAAEQLHETAHEECFIASSCSVPIRHVATVRIP